MLIRELRATMAKPRLQRWLSGPDEVAAYVADVSRWATHLPDPIDIDFTACRDPNDAFILAFGLQTEADAIVSGDKDLTVLVRHRPSVLTPRRALDRLDD